MKIGLTVVVLALMGTILAGSVAFSSTPVLETEYERVSDLAPIVTASSVDSSELYNPITNLTGWDNVVYSTQASPSVYPKVTSGTYTTWTSGNFSDYGGQYYTQTAGVITGSTYSDTSSHLYWSDGSNGSYAASNMIGGYAGSAHVTRAGGFGDYYEWYVYWDVSFDTTDATNSTPVYWQDLTKVATANNWSNVVLTSDANIRPAEIQFTTNGEGETGGSGFTTTYTKRVNLHLEPSAYTPGDKYIWDQTRSHWYKITGYGPNNEPAMAAESTELFWVKGVSDTITGEKYIPGNVIYIVPYSQVTINTGETATWSNGYNNVRVQILADPTVTVIASDGSSTVTINLPTEAQSYTKVLITIGSSSGDRYWQGITNYVSPTNYTLFDYRYTIPGGAALDSVDALTVSESSMAYIANTWVPTDPSGLLWLNPVMAPASYFPDVMSNGARIILSSILVTGDSLTIDGHTYNTSDKKIQIDGRWYGLNGFAVDYQDGHTYLNTPTGERFDLGVTGSQTISGSGVWYWSAELDSIKLVTGEKTNVLFAQMPSAEWSVFAFIGLLGLGILGLAALGRESLDGLDWIIMILAAVFALMLVMT